MDGKTLSGKVTHEEAGFDHAFGYEEATEYEIEGFKITIINKHGKVMDRTAMYYKNRNVYDAYKQEFLERYLEDNLNG